MSKTKTPSPAASILDNPVLKHWEAGEVRLTKDVARQLGTSTVKAYRLLLIEEKAGAVSCFGYRVKNGWEDLNFHGGRSSQSLGWQRNG